MFGRCNLVGKDVTSIGPGSLSPSTEALSIEDSSVSFFASSLRAGGGVTPTSVSDGSPALITRGEVVLHVSATSMTAGEADSTTSSGACFSLGGEPAIRVDSGSLETFERGAQLVGADGVGGPTCPPGADGTEIGGVGMIQRTLLDGTPTHLISPRTVDEASSFVLRSVASPGDLCFVAVSGAAAVPFDLDLPLYVDFPLTSFVLGTAGGLGSAQALFTLGSVPAGLGALDLHFQTASVDGAGVLAVGSPAYTAFLDTIP